MRAGTKGARTRERILEAATDLVHGRGMNAVSLSDVLRASDAGRGQFYRHFEGRQALVNEVLDRHRAAIATAGPVRSWEELRGWMDRHLRSQAGRRAPARLPGGHGRLPRGRAGGRAPARRRRPRAPGRLRRRRRSGRDAAGPARPRPAARGPRAGEAAAAEALAHLESYRTP